MIQNEKMAFRKAKELQAASNSNSLKEIKDLLNTKFSELGTRLTSLNEKLLSHISTPFTCCQNYKLGHVGKNKICNY